jgi:prepilin-type N-terminal cleavage/methylation domain-containing protein
MTRKGFTLLELLIAIGIIAILAGIVIVSINPIRQLIQSEDARRTHSANELQKALVQYQIDFGTFPGDRTIPEGVENAIPICRASYAESGAGGCVNVDLLLYTTNYYISCIPHDGQETDTEHSGYSVYQVSDRPQIVSLYLEQGSGGSDCETLPEPLAQWRLDEALAGSTVSDTSGNNHNGTPYGNGGANALPQPSNDVSPTRFGNVYSLHFDGTDDYVDVGTFDVTGDTMTLSAWYKADVFGYDPRILSKAEGWQSGKTYWLIGINDSPDRLRFRLTADSVEHTIDAGNPTTGTWTHIAGVYDGSSMRLYMNGTEVGTSAVTGTIRTGGASVWIGANPPTVSDRPFEGRIDEIRVYDMALSAGQILSLARGNP